MSDTEVISSSDPPFPREATWTRRVSALLSPKNILITAVVALIAYLVLVPLFYLLHDTFVGQQGVTFDAFTRGYGESSGAGRMLLNSLTFAAGSTALAMLVGTALAYIYVRTDAPLKKLFFVASLGPFLIPGVLHTTAWIFLADPRIGLLNDAIIRPIFAGASLNIFSIPGMIWVQGLHSVPIAFLLMVVGFRAIDMSYEESALMSGASTWTVLRRVTLPLARPAIATASLIVFVQSIENFEVPALLGLPNGVYVFTSQIYRELISVASDFGVAGAYSITLLIIAACGVLLVGWLSRSGRRYQTLGGKAFRLRTIQLGRAKPLVSMFVLGYFIVALVLPLGVVLYRALLPHYQAPSVAAFQSMTLTSFVDVLRMPTMLTAVTNTVVLAACAATIVMFLTAIAAWFIVRTNTPGRRVLDVVSFTPMVIPGIVLGVALLFVYLRVPLPIYGSIVILLIAFVTANLPYGMRFGNSAMSQLSREVEESAYMCGASWWQTFRRILVPLVGSGLIAGWIFVVLIVFRQLSFVVILTEPGNQVLALLMFELIQVGSFSDVAVIGLYMVALMMLIMVVAQRLGARLGLGLDSSGI